MKRTTQAAIVAIAALVLLPTVVALAQGGATDGLATTCRAHHNLTADMMPCSADGDHMMGQTGMEMMGQTGMEMMGQTGMEMMGQTGMEMMGQAGMEMMGQAGMEMMGQTGMSAEECPMRDEVRG